MDRQPRCRRLAAQGNAGCAGVPRAGAGGARPGPARPRSAADPRQGRSDPAPSGARQRKGAPMIRLDRKVIEAVQAAASREELYPWLQNAIELEHSTIPPYLTAMFSLKPGKNDEIARLIRSIVQEEMLHMTIVGNILIAIGGHPAINLPRFIPKYPGPLPMSIGGSGFI